MAWAGGSERKNLQAAVALNAEAARLAWHVVDNRLSANRHIRVNPHLPIGRGTTVGDLVGVYPKTSGGRIIEADELLVVRALVLKQLKVGQHALVRGGACVKHVPSGVAVKEALAR